MKLHYGVLVCLVMLCQLKVIAGAAPMPVEAEVDLAKYVVLEDITQIKELDTDKDKAVHWGIATVNVVEALKGTPTKTLDFRVPMSVSPKYQGAAVIHTYKVGDFGYWLIDAGDIVEGAYGLLKEDAKPDVREILKTLKARTWSAPVEGLKAWAAAVEPNYHTIPAIIFAINNTSREDLYVPTELNKGCIVAEVMNERGEKTSYPLLRGEQSKVVFCRKLNPGDTMYMHPAYTCIDLYNYTRLSPGRYTVVITYKNDRQEGETKSGKPTEMMPVKAWKGEVSAPPVDIIIKEDKGRE